MRIMSNIPKCDFYCELTELERLEVICRTSADELSELFFEFEAVINKNSNREHWKGESNEAFVTAFDKWKKDYVCIITSMTLLDDALANIYLYITELTQKKTNLENAVDIL